MLWTFDLVDHVVHIVITVHITFAAIGMLRLLLLVLDHSRFGIEVLIALWVGAFDFHG